MKFYQLFIISIFISAGIIIGNMFFASKTVTEVKEKASLEQYRAVYDEVRLSFLLYEQETLYDIENFDLEKFSNYFESDNYLYDASSETSANISTKKGMKLCDLILDEEKIIVNCGESVEVKTIPLR